MSTALFEIATSIPQRIKELNILTTHAEFCQVDNEELYNSLCRASSVLIASHLEGFLKELTNGLIQDLNFNLGSFSKMPTAIQRTFCKKIAFYEGIPDKEIEGRVSQLLDFFSRNSVPIDLKAFNYKQNQNKNPSASFIDGLFSPMGINSIIDSIEGSTFEQVFENNTRINFMLSRDMSRYRSKLYHYPYASLPSKYGFNFKNERKVKKDNSSKSLWHTFIEEILTTRHSIAHGDTIKNDTTAESLKFEIVKLEIFMHSMMYATAAYFSK